MRVFAAFSLLGALALCACGDRPSAPHYDLSPEANRKFLTDNAARKDVTTLPDGLQYRVIAAGHGARVKSPTDIVTVTYKGWTIDGHVFDKTDPGQTASFPAGQLIPGWVEALRLMHAGDEWEIVVPAELGYGADGAGADIGPNQTLVFDMKLVAVHPAEQP